MHRLVATALLTSVFGIGPAFAEPLPQNPQSHTRHRLVTPVVQTVHTEVPAGRAEPRYAPARREETRYAAARGWVDAIIDPLKTREVLVQALDVATRQRETASFPVGVFQV